MSIETDRIEADLNASRHRLNDTLDAIGHKLSPGQMLDEALGLAQGQAGQFAGKLGRQVRDNPMPTVLIAAGLAWLMMSNREHSQNNLSDEDWRHERRYRSLEEARWATSRNVGESDDDYDHRVHQAYARSLDMKQMAGEAAHEFKARVGKAVNAAGEAAHVVRERVGQTLASAKHAAQDSVSGATHFAQDQARNVGQGVTDARHKAEDFYQETPLAAGAIALAIGALLGGVTPLSRQEREGLGGVAEKAARTGAELAERGARAVEETVDRAVH